MVLNISKGETDFRKAQKSSVYFYQKIELKEGPENAPVGDTFDTTQDVCGQQRAGS